MNRLIILVFFTCFFSCKKDVKKSTLINENNNVVKNDSVKKITISIATSVNFADNWSEIVAFENELNRLVESSIQTEKDIELLKKLLQDLKDTCPERFKTNTIDVRIKVLETEVLMLEQSLKDQSLSKINTELSRILKAYNVFIWQIEALILKEKDYEKYN